MRSEIYHLSQQLGSALLLQNATVTSAESCTGGGVAQAITAVAGSSKWFNRSYVTYANRAKREMLGVDKQLLDDYGAVSEPVVIAMAKGAARGAAADYAVAVSGIAGPDGGSEEKPVGTVWFAWHSPQGTVARKYLLSGNRESVREQAVEISLQELLHQVAGCNTV